jgi:hypothetical protein
VGLGPTTDGKEKMTITKKHLNELADIVYMAHHSSMVSDQPHADLETISNEIKSFAKRHAPNFDESRWRDYLHKLEQRK